MLLLSQTSSGLGIAVIALAALALGLLVAMTVPLPKSRPVRRTGAAARRERAEPVQRATVPAAAAPAGRRRVRVRGRAVRHTRTGGPVTARTRRKHRTAAPCVSRC